MFSNVPQKGHKAYMGYIQGEVHVNSVSPNVNDPMFTSGKESLNLVNLFP